MHALVCYIASPRQPGISRCAAVGCCQLMWIGLLSLDCCFLGGFERVFSMDKLRSFSAYELQLLLCGEQTPNWSREDILNYTEPKFGYTRER